MSSLLERMAKRARAPLNGATPLQPARFAPRPTEAWPVPEDPTDTGAVPAIADAPEERPPLPAPSDAAAPVEAATTAKRALAPTGERKPALAAASEGPVSERAVARPRATVRQTSQPPAPPATPRPARNEGPPRPLPDEDPAPPTRDPVGSALAPVPREPSDRQPRPRRRGERPAAEAAAEAQPEVTIAIGHIEVRGAPEPQRPQARPPFRPRVSLDEFLKAGQR